jgi:hypothetical protein
MFEGAREFEQRLGAKRVSLFRPIDGDPSDAVRDLIEDVAIFIGLMPLRKRRRTKFVERIVGRSLDDGLWHRFTLPFDAESEVSTAKNPSARRCDAPTGTANAYRTIPVATS